MFISYEELRCSHTAWLYGVYKCRGHASYCVNVLIWNRCMPKYLFQFYSLSLSHSFCSFRFCEENCWHYVLLVDWKKTINCSQCIATDLIKYEIMVEQKPQYKWLLYINSIKFI